MKLSVIRAKTPPGAPLRIALAGYGTVGQALAARLAGDARFRIDAILVRDPSRARAVPAPCPLTADRAAFVAAPAEILVDALSCSETAAALALEALPRGTDLVSAGKQAVASRHAELTAAAQAGGARLLYSASVGGETPVLETVAAARKTAPVREVAGILNGTVNFLLTRIARGEPFAAALAAARGAGFAEEDCAADLTGADAAAKLRLIAAEAWGIEPRMLDVATEPLDRAAVDRIAASGERWVQLARAGRDGGRITASVRLVPRSAAPALPEAEDEWNCVAVTRADGAVLRCLGRGAGGAPTAAAIVSDLERLLPAADARLALRVAAC